MSFRLYKEGQGIWARGSLATMVGVTGLYATVSFFAWLEGTEWSRNVLFRIPFLEWSIRVQSVAAIAVLLPFVIGGVWLYNNPRLSDFLIDTEGELKNKVTWPTRKVTINNSIVVIVTCVILGLWISFADVVFQKVQDLLYGLAN
jgi:preprotein translocase SecE subunit